MLKKRIELIKKYCKRCQLNNGDSVNIKHTLKVYFKLIQHTYKQKGLKFFIKRFIILFPRKIYNTILLLKFKLYHKLKSKPSTFVFNNSKYDYFYDKWDSEGQLKFR